MGIRETLNKKPALVTGVTIGIVVIALVAIFWQSRTPPVKGVTHAYYTTDDGETTFEDELDKPTPFDHNGAQAVLVHMFSCDNGRTRFPGFLEKLPEKLPRATGTGGHDPRLFLTLIKAPKNKNAKWVAKTSPEGSAVIAAIQCPDGSGKGPAVEVFAK